MLIVLMVASFSAAGDNLLANPSLERLNSGWPVAWQLFVMPKDGAFGRVDGAVAHDGGQSVMLHTPEFYEREPANNWSQNILRDLGGRTVYVSGYIRTEAATEASIWLQCCRQSPFSILRSATTSEQDIPVTGTTDWIRVGLRVDVPEDTEFLTLRCVLLGRGTAWFDNLTVSEQADPLLVLIETEQAASPPAPAAEESPQTPRPALSEEAVTALMETYAALSDANRRLQETNESLLGEMSSLKDEVGRLREEIRLRLDGQTETPPPAESPNIDITIGMEPGEAPAADVQPNEGIREPSEPVAEPSESAVQVLPRQPAAPSAQTAEPKGLASQPTDRGVSPVPGRAPVDGIVQVFPEQSVSPILEDDKDALDSAAQPGAAQSIPTQPITPDEEEEEAPDPGVPGQTQTTPLEHLAPNGNAPAEPPPSDVEQEQVPSQAVSRPDAAAPRGVPDETASVSPGAPGGARDAQPSAPQRSPEGDAGVQMEQVPAGQPVGPMAAVPPQPERPAVPAPPAEPPPPAEPEPPVVPEPPVIAPPIMPEPPVAPPPPALPEPPVVTEPPVVAPPIMPEPPVAPPPPALPEPPVAVPPVVPEPPVVPGPPVIPGPPVAPGPPVEPPPPAEPLPPGEAGPPRTAEAPGAGQYGAVPGQQDLARVEVDIFTTGPPYWPPPLVPADDMSMPPPLVASDSSYQPRKRPAGPPPLVPHHREAE